MTTQPEQVLENNLITQLISLGHKSVVIKTEEDLLSNLKSQLEKHNKITFTASEFERILIHLSKGNIFDKAKTLRDKYVLHKDNGEKAYIEFVNQDFWCQNQFQVTNQITINGKRENRYDVTILINGLPLVQIELKRRGIELKEAFNQIQRYQKESFASNNALFNYVQIFVISNGVDTKYYANSQKQSFKFTSFWSDEKNKKITQLDKFTSIFLEPCHIAKMITKYTVLHESDKKLMILRPYQYYAVESIIDRVKNSDKNGYIWHTTGSGKTLTSFKASQILTNNPKIKKVVFVVDRQDLDDQTVREFQAFDKESIDGTENTKMLINQFLDNNRPLLVTTIQKLNSAISKAKFRKQIEALKDEKVVFIFDECHRSQFGDTHKRIVNFFTNHQLFGFTGTPIFVKNAISKKSIKQTTANLFHECLHQYVITDAIRDENVLKFSIEYYNVFKSKEGVDDTKVEDIDKQEVYESDDYLNAITNYIIANHNRKTHHRAFTAMFCVSSVDILIKYYELLKAKKEAGEHRLNIATIFSYAANPEDADANGEIVEEDFPDMMMAAEPTANYGSIPRKDKLDEYINDYNKQFGSKHSARDGNTFLNYKKDISKRVKNKQIDILLVVNMFLTGFDSKSLNTLYVDKNLNYHGLIQAYSRTNRILNEKKSQGNILAFRNLKQNTDDAIALFSDKNAQETIIIAPYDEQIAKFNEAYKVLMAIAPTVDSVNDLVTEEDELEFAKAFREIMRLKNILSSFVEFSFDDTYMKDQEFADYTSKYLDLYDKIKTNNQKETVSILDEIDFELELIHRDEINVAYIMKLLAQLKDAKPKDQAKQKKQIIDLIAGESELRSKRVLIEKFIQNNLPKINDSEAIEDEFKNYWQLETKKALQDLSKAEALKQDKVEDIINDFLFTGRMATEDEVIEALEKQPSVLQRESISTRITEKIKDFVKTFINGVDN
ncbi:type I restriction endonuclease subunit R [Tenacibaculum sp. AHE15PA]|uniref:type I restriction endonuclease subunit R n=1 Tax=unclassified Tenacibaculum TaxID=2635139 RepID=UPI001C4F17A8|nr:MULTISPECIES: type I restriction endonuclease subunit R [unclassified Tenacibaculum]QXP74664.1 type I restriction endonuclease subunit R [Tenacibaculum sp. AHE14PA]QXP76175.1 type I restriction endonuclease subunit R [Tenacibaculum sp. AHE15PA]